MYHPLLYLWQRPSLILQMTVSKPRHAANPSQAQLSITSCQTYLTMPIRDSDKKITFSFKWLINPDTLSFFPVCDIYHRMLQTDVF